jgi:hypothetical protein
MDIEMLRALTQSKDLKQLRSKTLSLGAALSELDTPPNEGARWGAFMLGLAAACTVEGWIAHDLKSEHEDPCCSLVNVFLEFCEKAYDEAWFRNTPSLVTMMNKVLEVEARRLTEDGWTDDSFEHSYLYRYMEYAFTGAIDAVDGVQVFRLTVTPEG